MIRTDMLRSTIVIRLSLSLAFLLAICLTAAAQEAGNLEKGKLVYNRCKACHQVGPEARNLAGPQLNGIIGRPVGSVKGYGYSKALSEHGGSWDSASLTAFLTNPRKAAPGTKMAFAGVKSAADIRDLLVYLALFNSTGQPSE